MKELSIEEKAQRFDEALERAKEWFKPEEPDSYTCIVESIFPELKESEDEKMMNQLHSWVKEFGGAEEYTEKVYQWIKGLLEKQGEQPKKNDVCNNCDQQGSCVSPCPMKLVEKQGEQKFAEWHRGDEQNLNSCLGYIPDEFLRKWLTEIIHVKYDKPADKVEPKFKVGDWVTIKE